MSFSGTPGAPQAPEVLINNAFFPDVDSGDFVALYRIPSEISAAIIKHHLILAMGRVNSALNEYRTEQQALGLLALIDVPAEAIGGVHPLAALYLRAVCCEAKAELLKETETVDRRAVAENAAKTSEETEDKLREFAQSAIRSICGLNRIGVELL